MYLLDLTLGKGVELAEESSKNPVLRQIIHQVDPGAGWRHHQVTNCQVYDEIICRCAHAFILPYYVHHENISHEGEECNHTVSDAFNDDFPQRAFWYVNRVGIILIRKRLLIVYRSVGGVESQIPSIFKRSVPSHISSIVIIIHLPGCWVLHCYIHSVVYLNWILESSLDRSDNLWWAFCFCKRFITLILDFKSKHKLFLLE